MRIKMNWPAPEHMRFANGAFDTSVGKQITLNLPDGSHVPATIAAVDNTPERAVFEFDVTDPEGCVVLSAYVATGGVDNLTIVQET
jgi:hypothetical protein